MNTIEISNELIQFIESSPSMFHSIKTIRTYLEEDGFTYLPESCAWDVKEGGKYYTIRNHSSLIAFKVGKDLDSYHFQMCASHSDSPTYKVKSVPELEGPKEYLRLDVEAYGGMIDNTWFDRPLSVAGRVLVGNGSKIESKLLYIDKDILMIPNVAIHFNREVNNGYKYNRQIDLCPMFSCGALKKGAFDKMVADELGVKAEGNKVIFTLSNPSPQFKSLLSFSNFVPQHKEFVEKTGKQYGTKSDKQIYSGPFKVENWNGTSGSFKLVKNNNYWDAKHVKTKTINIQTVKKPDTAVQMYKQGQLDFASISSTSAIFNSNKKNKDVVTVPEATTSYMTYNETGKVKGLDNLKIRQALNLATDRKGIVEAAVDTGSVPDRSNGC